MILIFQGLLGAEYSIGILFDNSMSQAEVSGSRGHRQTVVYLLPPSTLNVMLSYCGKKILVDRQHYNMDKGEKCKWAVGNYDKGQIVRGKISVYRKLSAEKGQYRHDQICFKIYWMQKIGDTVTVQMIQNERETVPQVLLKVIRNSDFEASGPGMELTLLSETVLSLIA